MTDILRAWHNVLSRILRRFLFAFIDQNTQSLVYLLRTNTVNDYMHMCAYVWARTKRNQAESYQNVENYRENRSIGVFWGMLTTESGWKFGMFARSENETRVLWGGRLTEECFKKFLQHLVQAPSRFLFPNLSRYQNFLSCDQTLSKNYLK